MVITASTNSALPKAALPGIMLAQMTISPNTPLFVRMPESSALAGAGATGWALGSQMCSGNMPAFAAKPTRVSHTATVRVPLAPWAMAAFSPVKDSVPVSCQSRNRPISVVRPPITATAR